MIELTIASNEDLISSRFVSSTFFLLTAGNDLSLKPFAHLFVLLLTEIQEIFEGPDLPVDMITNSDKSLQEAC